MSEVLLHYTRAGKVESVHRGDIVAVNTKGEIYMLFDRKNDKDEQYNLAASEGAVDIENDIRKKLLTAIAENIIIPSTTVQTAKAVTKN